MHIPDGFINAGTSLAAGGVAAGGIGVAVKKADAYLEDRQVRSGSHSSRGSRRAMGCRIGIPPPRGNRGGGRPDGHVSTRALEVRGLAFSYPDGHQALFGCDLEIGRGERVALLGPNGAGKTTLILHLNGVLAPSLGKVAVGGLDVNKANLKEIRRRVGIVFQDPDDQLFMPTVAEDVAFGPRTSVSASRRPGFVSTVPWTPWAWRSTARAHLTI